jgi:hypothetical protein
MSIPQLDIAGGDTIYTLQTILNQVVDKVVTGVSFTAPRTLTLTFQDATTLTVSLPDIAGRVIEGCAVTRSSALVYAVASGTVQAGGTVHSVSSGQLSLGSKDSTNPRLDALVVSGGGTLAVRAGVAGSSPALPTLTSGDTVLAYVYVPSVASGDLDGMAYTLPSDTAMRATKVAVKGAATLLPWQRIVLLDTPGASSAFDLTLPAPGLMDGAVIALYDMGSAGSKNVTVKVPSGQINGSSSFVISSNNRVVHITSHNGNYYAG